MKLMVYILALAFAPAALALAQNSPGNSSQGQADNEPVMFTLTIDEEMIKALRDGQSLMSTIPASIRGKVDRIRIEFKPSTNAANPANAGPPSTGNSILNRGGGVQTPSRSGGSNFGQPNGAGASQPPPLRAPDLNGGFDRANGSSKAGSNPSGTNDDSWTRNNATPNRSTSLTPIDEPRRGWLMGNRSDSNAVASNGGRSTGIQTSNPFPANYPLNRTALEEPPSADSLYTGPPAVSRSLPPLEPGFGSSGISSSVPMLHQAADKTPSFDSSQVLSKPPAEGSGKQPLAAGDISATRQADRTQVYMFMLLLCSLGLNVYLAWISRGFYVRYHDLAAELRETFTPGNAV